jgi:hypothetical protein
LAPRSHPQSKASPALLPSPFAGPIAPARHVGPGQLHGKTWNGFLTRQNERIKKQFEKADIGQREILEFRKRAAEKRQCPGKKCPTVYT